MSTDVPIAVSAPAATEADTQRRGALYGAAAYVLWGVFPLYFPLLEPAGTIEILAQRMAWSLIVMLVVLQFGGRFAGGVGGRRAGRLAGGAGGGPGGRLGGGLGAGFGEVRAVVRDRRQFGLLALGAAFIAVNWGTYIYGVNSEHVVETSLGYFINPLFTILLGVFVLRERLRPAQWVAVAIGALAVVVIAVDYGRPPWIALVLAISFGMYGFCKKRAGAGAVSSLAVETGVQFVPAVLVLTVLGFQGSLVFGTRPATSVLLAGAGVITVVPLLFFAAATRRLPLSILGLLQYLAPVLQFAVGVFVRHEVLPVAELIGFCLVWLALIVLTIDSLRQSRSSRRLASAAPPPVPV